MDSFFEAFVAFGSFGSSGRSDRLQMNDFERS
jgi:hypothetical protein